MSLRLSVPDPLVVKVFLKALVLPPFGPMLVIAVGLLLVHRTRRAGLAIAWTGLIVLFALALPITATWLLRALDDSPPLDAARASTAGAIVILGGGTRRDAPEYEGDTLGRLTLERVRYGAWVARKLGLPVLVSGGATYGGDTEGSMMRRALETEFGVKVRWVEQRSRTTHENAQRSARMLLDSGIQRVVLVAHSFDIPRARAEFAAAGIDIIPAPTGMPGDGPDTLFDFVPSVGGLQASYYALYEMLALAVFRMGVRY